MDPSPTPEGEYKGDFSGEAGRAEKIKNDLSQQDLNQRKEYADRAYGVTQTWVGFIIVVILAQITLRALGVPTLDATEFIAVITTTTTAIVAFWLLVGRGLFNGN